MEEMTISGTSRFDNGKSVQGTLNVLPLGDTTANRDIGLVLGVGTLNFNNHDTDTFTASDEVQTKQFTNSMSLVWEQATDGATVDFVDIPLPEPSMMLGLPARALLLAAMNGQT